MEMKKLDFEHLRVPLGIRGESYETVDAREALADLLYTRMCGLQAHHLAFKIYESGPETEYSDEEQELLLRVAERWCLPSVIDAVKRLMGNDKPIK